MSSVKKEIRQSAIKRAKEVLTKEDNRLKLSLAVIICAVLTVLMWLLSQMTDMVLYIFGVNYEYLYYPVSVLSLVILLVYLVIPLYVGTYRMSVNMLSGQNTEIADIFDVFSSFRAYNRALGLSFGMFFRILPIIIALRIHYIMDYLSNWLVFFEETEKAVDIAFIPLAILLVFWACRSFGNISLAYLDESQRIKRTRKLGRKIRKGNYKIIIALAYTTLFKLILSLLTLGILTIFHTVPLAMLTYGAAADQMKQNYDIKTERTDIQ